MSLKTEVFGGVENKFQSRAKGNRNELVLAKLLTEWTGVKFERTPRSGGLHWPAEFACGDVVCISKTFTFPFSVETKHYKNLGIPDDGTMYFRSNSIMLKFWAQAEEDSRRSMKMPIVFARENVSKRSRLKVKDYYVLIPIELEEKIALPPLAFLRRGGSTIAFCVMGSRLFSNPFEYYNL